MLKGNKGDWTEVYVLIKLIAEGKLYQSDINLSKDTGNVYEIIKGYKSEQSYDLEFERDTHIRLSKLVNENKFLIGEFEVSYFENLSKILLDGINNGKGRSFSIDNILKDFENFEIEKIKANSSSKADIKLRIYDHRLAKETDLGFSIKSLLGSKSTLFNTGYGNSFIYKIDDKLKETVQSFNERTYDPSKFKQGKISKITYRLNELHKFKCNINYKEIESRQLWKNLKMIDGDLPEILSYALYYRYKNSERSLKKVSDILEEKDPLNFYDGAKSEQKLYEYKLKKFLAESAMGMTSETPWLGEYDSFGGVIIAKKDGDLVCFHIYDFNLFRNYLLNNTVFEQPSTGEDENNPGNRSNKKNVKKYFYGWLVKSDESLEFKINLQIRFK